MTLWGQTMSAPTCIFAVNFSSASLAFSDIICYKRGAPAGGFAAQIIKRKNFLRAPCYFGNYML